MEVLGTFEQDIFPYIQHSVKIIWFLSCYLGSMIAYKLSYYLFPLTLTPLLIAASTPWQHAPGEAPLRDLGFCSQWPKLSEPRSVECPWSQSSQKSHSGHSSHTVVLVSSRLGCSSRSPWVCGATAWPTRTSSASQTPTSWCRARSPEGGGLPSGPRRLSRMTSTLSGEILCCMKANCLKMERN